MESKAQEERSAVIKSKGFFSCFATEGTKEREGATTGNFVGLVAGT